MNDAATSLLIFMVAVVIVAIGVPIYLEIQQHNDLKELCSELGYQNTYIAQGRYACENVSYDPVTGEKHIISFEPNLKMRNINE